MISNSPEILALGLLILRLVVGTVFFAHGAQKVFGWFGGHGLAGTSAYFKQSLGIPIPLTYLAAFTETFGALAVAAGVLTRLAAFGLAVTMLVALFRVHRKNGFWMNWASAANRGEGYEYNLTLAALCLFLALAGPGSLALVN